MTAAMLTAARAEALFCARVPAHPLTIDEATALIVAEVRRHHGVRGCACEVADEFGHHPETAAARMRWALAEVEQLYGHRRPTVVVARVGPAELPAAA